MELSIVLLDKLSKIHIRNEKPKQIHEEMGKRSLIPMAQKTRDALYSNTEPPFFVELLLPLDHFF